MKTYKVTCNEGVIVVNAGSRFDAERIAENTGYAVIEIEILI